MTGPSLWLDKVGTARTMHIGNQGDVIAQSYLDLSQMPLRWEAPLQESSGASAGVLDLYTGHAELGPHLLAEPASAQWSLQPGVSQSGGELSFAPSALTGELNAGVSIAVQSGDTYAVSFQWLDVALDGSQRVYVIAYDSQGKSLYTFPSGDGYASEPEQSWMHSYFGFDVPAGTTKVELLIRVRGTGTAEFRNVHIERF